MHISLIGVGQMGKAILPLLLSAGHKVSIWNRRPVVLDDMSNVDVLDDASEAFKKSDVVITLLSDDQAIQEVIIDTHALAEANKSVVHIVMSTISIDMVNELKKIHTDFRVAYIAAPVFGIPQVAAKGELNMLVAGDDGVIEKVQPILDVLSKKVWRLGTDQVAANITKVAGNMMITQAMASIAEASQLTQQYGLDPADFFNVITQTMFACPSYQRYSQKIVNQSFEPGFKLVLGLKDIDLALSAANAKKLNLRSAQQARMYMDEAVQKGQGEQDWSSLSLSVH